MGVEARRRRGLRGWFSAVLGWKEKEKELVAARKLPGARTTQAKLDPPFRTGNPYYSTQMLGDVVMLRGVTKNDRRRPFALSSRAPAPCSASPPTSASSRSPA